MSALPGRCPLSRWTQCHSQRPPLVGRSPLGCDYEGGGTDIGTAATHQAAALSRLSAERIWSAVFWIGDPHALIAFSASSLPSAQLAT